MPAASTTIADNVADTPSRMRRCVKANALPGQLDGVGITFPSTCAVGVLPLPGGGVAVLAIGPCPCFRRAFVEFAFMRCDGRPAFPAHRRTGQMPYSLTACDGLAAFSAVGSTPAHRSPAVMCSFLCRLPARLRRDDSTRLGGSDRHNHTHAPRLGHKYSDWVRVGRLVVVRQQLCRPTRRPASPQRGRPWSGRPSAWHPLTDCSRGTLLRPVQDVHNAALPDLWCSWDSP